MSQHDPVDSTYVPGAGAPTNGGLPAVPGGQLPVATGGYAPAAGVVYDVDVLTTGVFTGTLKPEKLVAALNARASQGWRLARSIHEEKRVFGIFKREAHFLIFERGRG